jgi:hypothetical protein
MMKDDQGGNQDDTLIGSVVEKTESWVESLSSAANSAVDLATKAATEITVAACQEKLDSLAAQKSIVNTCDVRHTGEYRICMAPLIDGMLMACALTIGEADKRCEGGAWVVCAPTNQGKTSAMEFLIHGDHSLRPKRSLKIDATNMKDFPKDCASFLNCPAAANSLAQILCQAVAGTAPNVAINFATKASLRARKMMCKPDVMIPFDTLIEMRDADQHGVLHLGQGSVPCPILIIDEFYCETKENVDFVRLLYKEASTLGVVVFIITTNKKWATKLIKLNGGEKIMPLVNNIDNDGYTGTERFVEEPQWNDLSWTVPQLRFLVGPYCLKHGLDPVKVIPEGRKYSPSEARKRAHNEATSIATVKQPPKRVIIS